MFYLLLQTYQKKGKTKHERVRDPGFIISASVINSGNTNLEREPDKAADTDNFSKPPEKNTPVTSKDEPLIKDSSVVWQSAVPINVPAEMGNMSDSLITIKSPEKNSDLMSNRDECSMNVSVCIILLHFYRLIYI